MRNLPLIPTNPFLPIRNKMQVDVSEKISLLTNRMSTGEN